MKPSIRILSHFGAVFIGIIIAGSVAGFSKPTSDSKPVVGKTTHSTDTENDRETPHAPKPGKESKPKLKPNEFQKAWDAVASRKLSLSDRMSLQRKILEKWAEVDLAGAMDAAMKEAWDGDTSFSNGTYYFNAPLLSAFSQAFSDRPLEAWELIQSGKFGVGAQILRGQWLESVSKSNGLLVASMLSELPGSLQKEAVMESLRNAKAGPERDALIAKIIEQAGDKHDDWIQAAFKDLPGGGDPVALRNQWTALPAGAARQVAMMKWGASLRTLDAEKLSSELANVPENAKAETAKAMLSQLNGESPGLLSALEFAIATDQWGSLAKSTASQLANFGERNHMDPAKLAEWGSNLPQRPDTVETFHKSIGRYIRDDLPRAKEWFQSMPEGSWQRDHGLAEFSQQALWGKNDPAFSQWALDSITDPAIKAEAQGWRHDWEEQTARR